MLFKWPPQVEETVYNERMKRIHQLINAGLTHQHYQSASLLVALDGQPLIHQAYGKAQLDSVFDLASLTKPLATTAVMMQLTAEGRLSPDTPLTRLLPELKWPGAKDLRIWHLLSHAAGLAAWRPYYQELTSRPARGRRQAMRRMVAATPPEAHAPAPMCYSDLGFILLDWALERCAGTRLDRLAHNKIFRPLGLTHTFFIDLDRAAPLVHHGHSLIVPTERCPWRKRRLRGEVHDDNCWAMGGVSGHAGLFSTAHDIHLLTRSLVAAYQGAPSLFSSRVVRRFFNHPPLPDSTRVLGWDTPTAERSSAGRLFGPHTVGHLGFTGTSLWVDLERSLWIIFLTNRVYYGREPNPMPALRPRLHDAIMSYCDRPPARAARGR